MAITRPISNIHISKGSSYSNYIRLLTRRVPVSHIPSVIASLNHVPDDKPYDRIKFVSIIIAIIMYIARLSRSDLQLATAYLATKAQHPKEGDHKVALRIISYMKATINHEIKIASQKL